MIWKKTILNAGVVLGAGFIAIPAIMAPQSTRFPALSDDWSILFLSRSLLAHSMRHAAFCPLDGPQPQQLLGGFHTLFDGGQTCSSATML